MDAEHQKRGFAFAYTKLQESNLHVVEGGHAWTYGMKSGACVHGLISSCGSPVVGIAVQFIDPDELWQPIHSLRGSTE